MTAIIKQQHINLCGKFKKKKEPTVTFENLKSFGAVLITASIASRGCHT